MAKNKTTQPKAKLQKRNKTLAVVAVIIIIAAGIVGAYKLFNSQALVPNGATSAVKNAADMAGGTPVYAIVGGHKRLVGRKLSSRVTFTERFDSSALSAWYMCVNARDTERKIDTVTYSSIRIGADIGGGGKVKILDGWYKMNGGPGGGGYKFNFTGNSTIILKKVSFYHNVNRCP